MNKQPTSRAQACTMAFALLAVLVAVPTSDVVDGSPRRIARGLPGGFDHVRDGRFGRDFDAAALAGSAVVRTVRPLHNTAMLGLFRATPPQVVATAGDWLFYAAGMHAPREPESSLHFEGRMAEVLDFAAVARDRNVPCSIWIVPEKWRVYGDQLDGLELPAARRQLHGRILAHLRARGVDAPDLLAELLALRREHPGTLLYSPGDTHPTGEALALLVQRHVPRLLGLAATTVQERLAAVGRGDPVWHYGDLLAMLQILPSSDVARRFSARRRPFLLPPPHDQPRSEVFVLGDSTMGCEDRLLPRLLQVASGMRVDARYVMDGILRSATARAEYAGFAPRLMVFSLGERRFASEW